MPKLKPSPGANREPSHPDSVPDQRRRRLLGRGLGAAPVLLTLVSRPVLGGGSYGGGGNWGGDTGKCYAPSGFASMPTSQHGKKTYCSGCKPSYWSNCDVSKGGNPWPSPYCATGSYDRWGNWQQPTKFRQPFSPCSGSYQTCTMLDALNLGGGSGQWGGSYGQWGSSQQSQVAQYCTAALLNAASGWTPVLTEARVKGIWSEYCTKGFFEPTAGVKWYGDDIVAYLSSTMPRG